LGLKDYNLAIVVRLHIRPVGLAIFALSVTFAPAIGPAIGGYLTDNYGWQTIFFINALPSAIMAIALAATLEKTPMRLHLLKEGDWAGIFTMAVGLSALQTVLEEGNKDDWFSSPFILKRTAGSTGTMTCSVSGLSSLVFQTLRLKRYSPL
jgi:MFS transporter, DHA2 family, multidrug resistance protein